MQNPTTAEAVIRMLAALPKGEKDKVLKWLQNNR
jgi:hypothetical protein